MSKIGALVLDIQNAEADRDEYINTRYLISCVLADYKKGENYSTTEAVNQILRITKTGLPDNICPNDTVIYIGSRLDLAYSSMYTVTGITPTHVQIEGIYVPKMDVFKVKV